MTDTIERATRQLYRAVEQSAALPPEECERIVRNIIQALRGPPVYAAERGVEALRNRGVTISTDDACACFNAMCASLAETPY